MFRIKVGDSSFPAEHWVLRYKTHRHNPANIVMHCRENGRQPEALADFNHYLQYGLTLS